MKINQVIAETINAVFRRVGVALRLEYITPGDAQRQLEQNPELLRTYGLSQKMSGDASDETVDAAKGRPFVPTLIYRLNNGLWRWYMGIVARAENTAILDGVTRFIAISKADVKKVSGVWVLTYNAADPKDFAWYDDPASGRMNNDVLGGLGLPSEMARVLAVVAPKAAGSVTDEGGYTRVIRDQWYAFFQQHEEEFMEAFQFVKENGGKAVIRKNLTAYVFFQFVSKHPKSPKANAARVLLNAYKSGVARTDIEVAMTDLRTFFIKHGKLLQERVECMPLFIRVLIAALEGKVMQENKDYYFGSKEPSNGGTPSYFVGYGKKPRTKTATAGR